MNYQKHLGKRVLLTCDGIYFGKTGTLINVVPTEWYSQTKIAHVTIDNSVAIVIPANQLIILKERK